MNYIGSKFKLLFWIEEEIKKTAGNNLSEKIFCDIFAGTGIVGRNFKAKVKKVISNDIEDYSYILNRNYIGNHKKLLDIKNFIKKLNDLPLIETGFIYKNYCMGSGSKRQYFSDEDGKKIDAIRTKIEEWKILKEINDDLYYFLLSSLIESADKVANTASVYGAFLKEVKNSAKRDLFLQPALFEINSNEHEVYKEDSNILIKKIKGDILYLDPPYNHRQYGANYHLLNTIAKYDYFDPKGKTGLREYYKSDYCKKQNAKISFEELIKNAKFKYIFLSYNNEGIMQEEEIATIMKKYGAYKIVKKEYQRFKADKTESRNHKADKTYEYLHILVKN